MKPEIKYPNFKLRLYLNLFVFTLFFLFIAYFYIKDTKQLVKTTNEIIDHPYTVSNSVRDIDIYIHAMHRSMKDVVLASDESNLNETVEVVDNYEKQIYLKFELVFEYFLGNPTDVEHAYDLFVAWKPIREKVIESVKANNYKEAAIITRKEGADHVSNLIRATEIMINYADKKAKEFTTESFKIQKVVKKRTLILVIAVLFSGIMLNFWTIRTITKPMSLIISRVKELFENKLDYLSKANNNTFYLLDKVVNELENSERKAREIIIKQTKELQEAGDLLEKSIDTASTAMVMVFTNGKFKNANEAFCKLIGYTKEELKNLTFNDITHPEDKHIGSEFIQKVLKGESNRSSFKKRYIKKTGEVILCSLSTSLVKSDESSMQYFFTQMQDITEQTNNELKLHKYKKELEVQVNTRTKELEQKAEKLEKSQKAMTYLLEDVNDMGNQLQLSNKMLLNANQELESFSYSVSHDLRAPIRAIDGFTKQLSEEYARLLDEEGKRILNIVLQSTKDMGQLIDDLLSFSRLGRKKLEMSPVNMEELVKDVVNEYVNFNKDKNPEIKIKQLPSLNGDRALIKQVIANLLSNAIKFTKPGKEADIEIGSLTKDHENVYYIKDQGVGFNMKYIHKIYDVFQRLHSAREFEGTGVGLAIVQRIVYRHNGKVWAEAEVNKGATFYFTLSNKIIKN